MPENTFIYDTVWEEFREELQYTYDEMCEAIIFAWDYRVMTGFAPEGCCSAN